MKLIFIFVIFLVNFDQCAVPLFDLAHTMQFTIKQTSSYVQNSNHFIQAIAQSKIGENDIVARLDMKSLYPNIPISEPLDQISENEKFSNDLMEQAEY